MSRETDLCVLTGAYCSTKDCPLYRDNKCDFIKAIHSILATFAPATQVAPRHDPASTEGVIEKILSLKPNLTREAVKRLIDEERAKAAGLLTEQAAAHLVAANLGLDRAQQPLIPKQMRPFPRMEEGDYVEITGELTEAPKYREVEIRREAVPLVELILTDGKIQVKATLWREHTKKAEALRVGDIVTITNMKVKRPYDGVDQISSTKNTKIT